MYNLFEFAVCLLAAYGLVMLLLVTLGRVRGRGPEKNPGVRVVLLVKDTEDQIEYIIRNVVKNDLASRVLSDNRLIVVDMNSSDNTYLLLEKLQKDFSSIEILKFEDRELLFEDYPIFSLPPK